MQFFKFLDTSGMSSLIFTKDLQNNVSKYSTYIYSCTVDIYIICFSYAIGLNENILCEYLKQLYITHTLDRVINLF